MIFYLFFNYFKGIFIMTDFFDFDSLTQTNSDPFEYSSAYVSEVNTRFYTLPKKKDGSG